MRLPEGATAAGSLLGLVGLFSIAGQAYTPVMSSAVGTSTPPEGTEVAVPFMAARSCTLTELAVNVTTAAAAGGLLRLGVRAAAATLVPGAVLYDSGGIAAVTTGNKVATPSLALVAGLVYWATLTEQGAAATRATIGTSTGSISQLGSSSRSGLLAAPVGCLIAGTTQSGALGTVTAWDNIAGNGVPRFSLIGT